MFLLLVVSKARDAGVTAVRYGNFENVHISARVLLPYTRSDVSLERSEKDKEPKLIRNNFQHAPNEVKTEQMNVLAAILFYCKYKSDER